MAQQSYRCRELRQRADVNDSPVTVGPRPESLELAPQAEGMPAIVDIVEELGAEAVVHAHIQGNDARSVTAARDVIARIDPGAAVVPGDKIHLRVNEGGILLFDPLSGARI